MNNADFVARLKYRTAEQGGRSVPAHSGYRPTIKFQFDSMYTSGEQKFHGRSFVHPGQEVIADIRIVSVIYFAGRLSKGDNFIFTEGQTIIGSGEIVEIINPILIKKPAANTAYT